MWSLSFSRLVPALVLVVLGGQTLTNDGMKSRTVPLVASMDCGFGDDGEHTRGATPFLVVKVGPSMMLWSMPVQCERCGRPGSNQGDGRVAEQASLSRADCQIGQ